jgi:predicted TIM-barrel fold metal-dependent hydrolase
MLTRRELLRNLSAAALGLDAGAARSAVRSERNSGEIEVPVSACDCHVHVFDPARFPYTPKRGYTPPPARVEELLELQRTLHLERVVVVQPSVYGTDNACTLDALRRLGARARGVAVIDASTSAAALDEMASAGIRGVRLNLEAAGEFNPPAAGERLDAAAKQIAGRRWHIQLNTRLPVIAALKDRLRQMPCPIVFDHFGGARAAAGAAQAGFDALLDLVRSGSAYVKVSAAYRASERPPDFADAGVLARALVSANPERVVWGTDWPHPDSDFGRTRPLTDVAPPIQVDDRRLLNELANWIPDAAVRAKILVENPARLYWF